ncbi:hypothetical protein HX109_05900 [Galbibacter sp. BG1]|uniref:hypothetical protein n=1 Tax=Galbibacter sp. BG1 TaxID=1170699 RepID=UPI0015BD082E|nr:hypothetical protein [Galbibacter sp. BG1]QLE01120.1 hypothetical protein HX109_05900 [Galbibacter sp. BG1]
MKKKTLKILLIVAGVLALLILAANIGLAHFIKNKIENNSSDYSFQVGETSVNLISRKVSLSNIRITSEKGDSARIKDIIVNDIFLGNLFHTDSLVIGSITLNEGEGFFTKRESKKKDDTSKKFTLQIADVKIKNTRLQYITDTTKGPIEVKKINLNLSNVRFNTVEKQKLTYENVLLDCEDITLPINDYLNFKIATLSADNSTIKTTKLGIKTLYSKEELQKHIKVQKDWIDLNIDSLNIKEYSKESSSKKSLFSSSTIDIYKGDLEIYKNKLLPEPTKYKPLYSKALRNLPFDLKIDTINIHNTQIKYVERVKNFNQPGSITFTQINSIIKNINTLEGSGKTNIDIQSKFMGDADFKLLWVFDINNKADYFTLHGNMKHLNADKINEFIKPNMNVETEGSIDSIVFDVYANENNANGTFMMTYEDFKISILKENQNVVNKFVTSIANVFVPKDKLKNKEVSIEIQRNKQKSFFNYFWLSVREGVKQTFL